jgi:1,2-phenylacetyl-CoA epoxidase catalytic subunit
MKPAYPKSNWDRVDRMKDEDIDLSDLPEIPLESFARAIVRKWLQAGVRKGREEPFNE